MKPDTTATQQAHRVLSLAALVAVAITLFLVGLAAFRDPEPPALTEPTAAHQPVRGPDDSVAPHALRQLEAVGDEGDAAVSRVFRTALGVLAIAAVMFALAAYGRAPPAFLRLSAALAVLCALSAVCVLLRDVAVWLAAIQVLGVTAALAVAARLVGRHALLDSPWHSLGASTVWPQTPSREARIEG